jgi:hypothetical protein
MRRYVIAAAAVTATLLASLPAMNATAMPAVSPPAPASLVQKTQIFCGPYGCGRIYYGPRHRRWRWGRWGYNYRPACPTGYYYACRPGPLGYGQCACWPYRPY